MTAARATRTDSTARTRLDEARGRLECRTGRGGGADRRPGARHRDHRRVGQGGATDDEHDAEGATIAFERAQAMALLEETRIQVEALDTALARVEHGSYGVCESCGQDIAPERLAARPSATLCITCASRRR